MDDLQHYCPVVHEEKIVLTPGESEPDTIQQFHYHPILFGGDQLTVARIRGSQRIRQNSEDEKGRLEGLVPCVEDWHTKVILLEVNLFLCFKHCIVIIYEQCFSGIYTGNVGQALQERYKHGRWHHSSAQELAEPLKCST